MRGPNRIRNVAAASFATALLACSAQALAGDGPVTRGNGENPAPYGKNDAGGFRNVLPPGQNGTVNAVELADHMLTGSLPEHWADQQDMYNGLVYAAAKQSFGMDDVRDHFKDATFGVKPGQIESVTTPRPGVTIVRDSRYGVPHVYGESRQDVEFGAGYASAADRLFLMDILRHTGKAQLSSFAGGSPSNRRMDHAQWQAAPYTEEELQMQVDLADEYYGRAGEQLQADLAAYIDGINAYIDEALLNPELLPAEYAAIGKLPEHWTGADVIATASLIGGEFGRGGGQELRSAQLLQAFQKRFGRKAGRRAWLDFRSKNDPEAPVTIPGRRFPYETTSPFAKRGLAMPDPGSVEPAPVAPPVRAGASATAPEGEFDPGKIGAGIRRALEHGLASHWELISARESETGRPIGVLGPQVGYYQPQILMEIDLHGPGFDARGATFPGVSLYVLLGHGRDYAWSATTATSDNVDTFAEVLCQDDFHYRYKGECLAMEKLERTNTWVPNANDMTPPGSETLTAYRTVHGIVYARGEVDGKQVAFTRARSTYFHEGDSALFFRRLNHPRLMRRGASSFTRAAKDMNFVFNWVYLDGRHTNYRLTGWFPQRARRTSPDFPVLGTGKYDWRGYRPARHTADWLPERRHPHAVDQRYIVSWNNKQAPGWSAADDQYAFSSVYRSEMISDKIRRLARGPGKVSLPELVKAGELPATQDVRAVELMPLLLRAVGRPKGELGRAVARLRSWWAAGSHRRDLDRDGTDEHSRAIRLMDAWWPKLVAAQFKPVLGKGLYEQTQGMVGIGLVGFSAPREYPSFSDGWYGYVDKDLRSLFGAGDPRGELSRRYCGRGSRARCRTALRSSLRAATKVSAAEVYGYGDCADDPDSECWDRNRATHASGVSTPELIFQNRPTFQQTVSVKRP